MVAELMPSPHPILSAVLVAQDAVRSVRDAQPVFLIPAEKETAVAELARLEAMAAELRLRVVAVAEDARADAGARDVGAWLASVTRADFPVGRADARLAEALDRRWTRVAAAVFSIFYFSLSFSFFFFFFCFAGSSAIDAVGRVITAQRRSEDGMNRSHAASQVATAWGYFLPQQSCGRVELIECDLGVRRGVDLPRAFATALRSL